MQMPLSRISQIEKSSLAKASDQFKKQAEALNTLMEKYKSEVAERYGITQEQLIDISVEALTKNWPMPEKSQRKAIQRFGVG